MRAFGILGGGVIHGSAAILGGVSTLAPYAGTGFLGRKCLFMLCYVMFAGLIGLGGGRALCMGPFFCRTQGGYCLIVTSSNGLRCPTSC